MLIYPFTIVASVKLEVSVYKATLWLKKKNTTRSEAEMSTTMARFTHLLQLIMMSSGLMRLFSMPIFGWSPRPRKRPGGSMRKFPILSLWLSMMQNPNSWRILSFSSLIFYRKAQKVKVSYGLQAWGRHVFESKNTCFSSLDICFLASVWALKYSFISAKLHLFKSAILLFSSDVISCSKSRAVLPQTWTALRR